MWATATRFTKRPLAGDNAKYRHLYADKCLSVARADRVGEAKLREELLKRMRPACVAVLAAPNGGGAGRRTRMLRDVVGWVVNFVGG